MESRQTPRVPLLVGERAHQLHVLKVEDIDYIESHGNYVKLHMRGLEYLSRDSVKRLAGVLRAAGFCRIERSLLVNVRSVRHAQRCGRGSYALTLLSGTQLRSGASYRDTIVHRLSLPPGPPCT